MSERKFLQLKDIDAYVISFHLSNYVWGIVIRWNYFPRDTIGKQFVRSMDSISANIAEGFKRYNKKDKTKFFIYSLASQQESLDWNEKSRIRYLLTTAQYNYIFRELNKLPKEINSLIKFTNEKLKK